MTGNEAGTTDDSSSSDDASDSGSTDEGTEQQLGILRVGIIPMLGTVPTQETAYLKMNPEMVRLEKMIPHRLQNLHLSRNPSVSVTTSAASMITTKTAPCAARIIRTANTRSRV